MKLKIENCALGIDGCRGGWLVIAWDGNNWDSQIIRERSQLIDLLQNARRTFIDIPIGLSDRDASRTCDRLLRKTLGQLYSSSVFSPPVRAAVYADTYESACQINHAKTGKKISIQSWNITPKIRQIDEIIQDYPEFIDRVLESHPEFLFWKLNRDRPLAHKKKTDLGKKLRVQLFKKQIQETPKTFAKTRRIYLKKEVADDDIIDAICLAYFAQESISNGLIYLPETLERDTQGLRMAIHASK